MMVVNLCNPYVRLCYPCSGQDIPPENWDFLADDGRATLRLELQGDLDGCGTMCTAINGIERVTVKVGCLASASCMTIGSKSNRNSRG